MEPIDKPFRFTWDFCVAWALLAVTTFLVTRQMASDQGWYAYSAILILLSAFATIVLYGPVLLARQIIRSGSRGWFVARVFLSVLIAIILFAVVMYFTGNGKHAQWWSGAVMCVAIGYLHWKLRS